MYYYNNHNYIIEKRKQNWLKKFKQKNKVAFDKVSKNDHGGGPSSDHSFPQQKYTPCVLEDITDVDIMSQFKMSCTAPSPQNG